MQGFTRRCHGGKFTGLSGAGFSGNQGLDLSSPREGSWWWVRIMLELLNFNLKVWGGHEVKMS